MFVMFSRDQLVKEAGQVKMADQGHRYGFHYLESRELY